VWKYIEICEYTFKDGVYERKEKEGKKLLTP
jgi:hypothetical protein